VDGVILAVREAGLPVSEALVVGCGGAGRAAAVAAFRLGCRVTLANRTPARAAALASELGCDWIPVDDLPALTPDLLIYTVPGPMEGLPDFRDAVILEANYRTPCLAGCGRAYIPGLRWLLYQAVAGYGIFTGETPDTDAMSGIFC
jgi:shikimate 5-dehydrogenase